MVILKNGVDYLVTFSPISKKDPFKNYYGTGGSVRFRVTPNRFGNSLFEWRFGGEDLYGST